MIMTIMFLAASLSPAIPSIADAGPSFTMDGDDVPRGVLLRLRVGTFDPTEGIPLSEDLKVSDGSEYLIVQFDGPVQEDWRHRLGSIGCSVIWYLPDLAFLVHAPGIEAMDLAQLPHVRYVGPYHPGYKISPAFEDDPEPKVVHIAPIGSPGKVVRKVEALGGEVLAAGPRDVRASLPASGIIPLARTPDVGWIEPGGHGSFFNNNSAVILRARQPVNGTYDDDGTSMWSHNGTHFFGTTGKDVNVMVTDSGIDGTHPTFDGRKIYFSNLTAPYDEWTDYMGHGTHCAGTVLGNGSWRPPPANQYDHGSYAGIAPEANLMAQMIGWDGNDDIWYGITVQEIINDTAAAGAHVSSNSWGCCGPAQDYSVTAQTYDDAVRDSNLTQDGDQSVVYVFASGNSGPGQVSNPGLAKNVITVGATGDRRGGYDEDYLTGFSSKGPTADGRRKPDVVAPGLWVMSALANNPNYSYTAMSGTSMATPGVAGASAVVIDHHNRTFGVIPSPAMVKAVLVNGADQLDNDNWRYADSNQGWGRVNLSRSLLETDGRKVWGEDQEHHLTTGDFVDYGFSVKESKELRVHLVWTDPGASPAAQKALINDLDLEVYAPDGTLYYANNFTDNETIPGDTPDDINNVEGFRLLNPSTGNWRVRVNASNIPQGPQDYAITINGWTDLSLQDVDLVAHDLSVSDDAPIEGDLIDIMANITNHALVNIDDVSYKVMVDDIELSNGTFPMERGETIEVDANWMAVRGLHTVRIEVDPEGLITETDEDNNLMELNITVDNYGLGIELGTLNDTALPGGPASWYLLVNNTGTLNDTYDITWDPVPEGWALDMVDHVNVTAGVIENVSMDLTTPVEALAGDDLTLDLYVSSVGNSTYNGTFNITATVLQTYDLSTSREPLTALIAPSGTVTYNLSVENLGNGEDLFRIATNMTASDNTNWTLELEASELLLGPGEARNLTLDLSVDDRAYVDDTASIEVGISSVGDPGLNVSHIITARVSPVFEMGSSLAPTNATLDPGTWTLHEVVVQNVGNTYENVTYTIDLPEGWGTSGDPTLVFLLPFSSTTFVVNISVPLDELAGSYLCNITVQRENGTEMDEIGTHNITIEVDPIYDISLTVRPEVLNGTAGDTFGIDIELRNDGNALDVLKISIDGLHSEWSLNLSMTYLELLPGQTMVVNAWMNTTNDTAGNYTMNITIDFGDGGTARAKVPLTLLEPPPPPPPPPPPKPEPKEDDLSGLFLLLAIIIAIIIGILALIAGIMLRRKARSRTEPPPPAEEEEYPETLAEQEGTEEEGPEPEEKAEGEGPEPEEKAQEKGPEEPGPEEKDTEGPVHEKEPPEGPETELDDLDSLIESLTKD